MTFLSMYLNVYKSEILLKEKYLNLFVRYFKIFYFPPNETKMWLFFMCESTSLLGEHD